MSRTIATLLSTDRESFSLYTIDNFILPRSTSLLSKSSFLRLSRFQSFLAPTEINKWKRINIFFLFSTMMKGKFLHSISKRITSHTLTCRSPNLSRPETPEKKRKRYGIQKNVNLGLTRRASKRCNISGLLTPSYRSSKHLHLLTCK